MARKIYSQLTETIDGDYVHPVIADNTEVDAVIHMGDASGRAWFSFNEENVTVDDSQDAKYGIVIYDAGDADTAAVRDSLTYVAQQDGHRKNVVTSAHSNFDLFEAILNADTDITDKIASARAAISAEHTELGF